MTVKRMGHLMFRGGVQKERLRRAREVGVTEKGGVPKPKRCVKDMCPVLHMGQLRTEN